MRRVKCDEGKPSCARCLKFGADCEGYDVGGRRDVHTTSSLREIFPRKNNHQAFISPSLGKLPFTAVFHDNREYSYFLHFQEKAALDIAGAFDRSLWSHVIIQASWNEQSLSRLIASLGALHKAKGAKASNLSKEETDPHQQYALQQYGRALKSVQARISANQYRDTTRIALIASILIYGFENLYGDLDFALGHLEGALQLMHKQLARATRHYKHSENKSPTSTLDDELVAAFFRLDCGLLSRDAMSCAETIGSRLGINYLESICEVPEKFNTVSEARNFLENIQFPTIPTLSCDLVLVLQMKRSPLPGDFDEKTRDMYTTMSSQLHRWNIAFKPLHAEILTPNSENFVAAATLRVRALSTEIALQRVCATELGSSYLLNTKSHELVNLSKLVAADPRFLKSFVWDCGIIPGLSIVIAACLDMSIRKEALQLLKQIIPRREGVWDSLTAVKFGERILQIK
jgi:hypothetical protein